MDIKNNILIDYIKVDGKNIYAGEDIKGEVNDDEIIVKTTIGKTRKQMFEIRFVKDDSNLIIDEDKTSSD